MGENVYIRMRQRVSAAPHDQLKVGQLAQVIASESIVSEVTSMPVYQIKIKDHNRVVIDVMEVIRIIRFHFPDVSFQTIGSAQTVIDIEVQKKSFKWIYIILVWFLLFVGAGLAIMNFHEDVSMRAVHLRIFQLVTGNEVAKPLMLQIPYSIGLGLGMILFFNHFFKKRLNDEPSPLEVEMFNYQQNLDQYVITHELKENQRKKNGH
ncbi:stage V sporulation protein AA [Bacillus sp. FJAT-45037]|uniref:stage V sporulation protein AA n=1 Tax=Bacillus sp. FJAT-45037 TaxID=2011007 RepID=UPI000C24D15A|nr:stage V sporulation protein AA [Bacillus sp. FJAT-45037]